MKRILSLIALTLIILPFNNVFSQTDEDIKFLVDSITALPDDTNKVIAYNKLIWQISTYDSTNSAFCAEKSIEIAEKLGYWKGVATAQKNFAAYFYYNGPYDQALNLYELSLENYKKANYKKGQAIAYRNLGNVHYQFANWETALNYYFESLKLREEVGDTVGKGMTLNSISNLYSQIPNMEDSALVYSFRALKIFENVDDLYNISSTYLTISGIYYSMSDDNKKDTTEYLRLLDSTIFYSKKCIEVSSIIGIKRIEATAYEAIGGAYLDIENYDSALYYINKSLEIRKEDDNSFGIANSLVALGNYYSQVNDYNNAKKYLTEAYNLSIKIKSDYVTESALGSLTNVYYSMGRYKTAFDYYEDYIHIRDSLMNQQKLQELTQASMQYEFDKKQKMQELEQQKKDAIKEAELQRQRQRSRFLLIGLIMMLLLAFLMFRSYQQKKKNNKILEDKNTQIILKNAQLNQSNEEIEAQRDEIERQKEFVEKQNKEITSSINYAQRIQRALLTPLAVLEKNLDDFFILYKPRDIVSGDYFWASRIGNKFVVTAADCTGHGVPGAFMSMLGISFLNQIVNQDFRNKPEQLNAAEILTRMRKMIIQSLGHGATEDSPQEGMDMALSIIDFDKKQLNFAGAYNPLIFIRDNQLEVIKPDKMPVGYHFIKIESNFTNQYIDYQDGDRFFMFSDGFQDQFGGEEGRKFTPKRLREMLIENHKLPMKEQKEIYDEIFINWHKTKLKEYRQLDDVILLGFSL